MQFDFIADLMSPPFLSQKQSLATKARLPMCPLHAYSRKIHDYTKNKCEGCMHSRSFDWMRGASRFCEFYLDICEERSISCSLNRTWYSHHYLWGFLFFWHVFCTTNVWLCQVPVARDTTDMWLYYTDWYPFIFSSCSCFVVKTIF